MKVKHIGLLTLKVVTLTILYFICFTIASGLLFPSPVTPPDASEGAGSVLLSLLAVCFLNTIVLTYVILRSRWAGWRLMLTIFVVSYGVMTLMGQMAAVFVTRLPAGMLPRLFLLGAVVAGLFTPLSVLILGKRKPEPLGHEANSRLLLPPSEWIWKLALIAIVYPILYFTFGYFIAWQNPAVREYYGGTDSGSFILQMGAVVRETPWLPFFLVLRAMIWTSLALPVIRMMKGPWWEAGLAVALLFSVVMNSQLLLPNPFMPAPVRMAHLVETASSNFLFAWFMVWLLLRRRAAARSLSYSRSGY